LSHAVVLKVVFIDNADGKWHVLSNYGSVPTAEEPGIQPAGSLGNGEGIVIKVTTKESASDTIASANIVCLLGENDDGAISDLQIADATILIAEEGEDYPVITSWKAPAGAEKIEVIWNKPESWKTTDIDLPYTTAVPAGATATFTLYFPEDAVIPVGDTLKVQLAARNTTGAWENIGITEDITSESLASEGGYLVYQGSVTGGNGLDLVNAIAVQLAYGYINYSGPVAVKLGTITAP
jgi:hypothetical protein